MKKIISYIITFNILFLNLSFLTFETVQASNEIYALNNKFIVSAYYSPLPNQKYYFKGSYEADKKLNGNGIRGASGKAVYPGMIAAPKNYPFGTKIHLDGIGIVEVSDRGGAIVSTDPNETRGYKYDRLDIWMGYGDEGLARALSFGKKELSGYVLADKETPVSINIDALPAPLNILTKYEVKEITLNDIKQEKEEVKNKLISSLNIDKENPNENEVKKLQNIFKEMGLYTGEINGKYENIKNELISYQVNSKIIKDKNSTEAGYFGAKSLNQLNKDYAIAKEKEQKIQKELAFIKKTVDNKIENHFNQIGSPKLGDVGENVRNLQKTLKTLGFFKVKDTAKFGEPTKNALINYQLKNNLINSKNEAGAGVFGPKTKETLKNELAIILETQLLKQKDLLSYKK
ncbi:peptidoglycan-binding protein [Candidatus Gracilibacteria bacterium]|nr:peptidoglycan-binding protein [Candidatus Gracilibacteria bacterium]